MELMDYQKSYAEFEQELDTEINKSAEGFVKIGYLLKIARDTNILQESGYENVAELAKKRYGLDKSQVSRFIRINDRFSVEGYSENLEERYRGFGLAKLSLMLLLPDEINEELTPEYSKAEIETIKEEVDAEQKLSDIEVMIEGEKPETLSLDNNLSKAVWQLGLDEPELFTAIHNAVRQQDWCLKKLQEIIIPAGEKIYSVRVQGVGRILLSMKENEAFVTTMNVRTGEKNSFSWENVMIAWKILCDTEQEDGQKAWEKTYSIGFPKVAPVQPKEEKGQQPKKETKVQKAKTEPPKKELPAADVEKEEKSDDGAELETIPDNAKLQTEGMEGNSNTGDADCPDDGEPTEKESIGSTTDTEQLPGQTDIENDFPELLPDGSSLTEEEREAAKQKQAEDRKKQIAGYKAGITSALKRMEMMVQEENWAALASNAEDIKWRAEQILKLGGQYHG